MFLKEFLSKLFFFGIVLYGINLAIIKLSSLFEPSYEFHAIHLILFLSSAIALIAIDRVFKKNKDVVGVSFLVISTIMTVLVLVVGKWLLTTEEPFLKWNYFFLFMGYLLCITFLTGKKLNQMIF